MGGAAARRVDGRSMGYFNNTHPHLIMVKPPHKPASSAHLSSCESCAAGACEVQEHRRAAAKKFQPCIIFSLLVKPPKAPEPPTPHQKCPDTHRNDVCMHGLGNVERRTAGGLQQHFWQIIGGFSCWSNSPRPLSPHQNTPHQKIPNTHRNYVCMYKQVSS